MKTNQLIFFVIGAAVAGLLCWSLAGPDLVVDGAREAFDLTVWILPQLLVGLLIAGFAQALLPQERMAALLGARSGLRGLGLASVIGALVPGGPFASFPIVHALARSGADVGAVVAFLLSWSLLGVQRFFIWDLPILGVDFSTLRYVVSLPMPLIGGLLARHLVARYASLHPFDPR